MKMKNLFSAHKSGGKKRAKNYLIEKVESKQIEKFIKSWGGTCIGICQMCFILITSLTRMYFSYVITELLQSDLHKIIVSPQHLSADHIKVFLYQILRGLKYLHSARILHRDIKPGNLLVNSNCVLKICDFGLARVEEPDQAKHMTQEVVTQYYRAPEILMGARHYSSAVDVWSVGCIFGELLGRRILFQAQNPVQQLELITELLGTPTMEDMRHACEGARTHMLRRAPKPPSFSVLYTLSSHATHEAVHLLCQMLVFDPVSSANLGGTQSSLLITLSYPPGTHRTSAFL